MEEKKWPKRREKYNWRPYIRPVLHGIYILLSKLSEKNKNKFKFIYTHIRNSMDIFIF